MKFKTLHINFIKLISCAFVIILSINDTFSQKYTEYEVKAVFIINFGKFVQWPESTKKSDTVFIFGIYGTNPFGEIFNNPSFKKVKINNKSYTVKYFYDLKHVDCDMLFVSGIEKYEMIQLLSYTYNKPILTIGDNIDDFCEKGGMINFTEKGYRFRFEINNDAALQANIKISSKLLNLAKIITVDEVKF